ncbi:MAG: galactokinase [Desulfobacterales bacterium]|nr:MAG: galactokinase [Desulfobacterales bacterium]
MGGTLDISTFYYPLRHLSPCTVNIAIGLRTKVCLLPYRDGMVKISSRGFKSAEYRLETVPFAHPLGLMFAIAAYFNVNGVHIDIDSSSPPRSALGGSSAAAVAMISAFSQALEKKGADPISKRQTALLAHTIEASVAGVPCGLQDQLAAVYGGINAWYWQAEIGRPPFKRQTILRKPLFNNFRHHLLLAYSGIPHESKNINNRWVRQFLSGDFRRYWSEIIDCTHQFAEALSNQNFVDAMKAMNREMAIRRIMTPEVLDTIGEQLVESAVENNCGARFTGAGGGGCIWALGHIEDIDKLKSIWERVLSGRKHAHLIDLEIDSKGVL